VALHDPLRTNSYNNSLKMLARMNRLMTWMALAGPVAQGK
jgi:hypothetical protein